VQKIKVYKPPLSWKAREILREKGQFWTPDWIAELMVEYVLADEGGVLFDPAVGTGAFFRAAKVISKEKGLTISFAGMEVDALVLSQSLEQGLSKEDIASVEISDFVLDPPQKKFSAIVGNPPYIRHHRINSGVKSQLRQFSFQVIGNSIDGRAGLHVYFFIRALTLLKDNGRLAFILPADICEGKFSHNLWAWIAKNFSIDAVITFSPEASPFPNIDTNPLIFLIRKTLPKEKFFWVKCYHPESSSLRAWIRSGFENTISNGEFYVARRDLKEGLLTGFSRGLLPKIDSTYCLGDFVKVMRGVATGANDFFFITNDKAKQLGIPERFLQKAIGRTRDVDGSEITIETLNYLENKGRPTLLLSLNGDDINHLPEPVRRYLQEGERIGLPHRPLIAQRKPWYKMEVRVPPPFLFAYLRRQNLRFIRNIAKVIPLTSFLCVYPRKNYQDKLDQLWELLNHPDVISNLALIGKSYGDGAIKVEPRFLEKLPIPNHVLKQINLKVEMRLFDDSSSYHIE